VDLTPAFSSGGTGSLKYSISFPTPKRGFLGLYPIDNTPGTSHEIDISSSVGTVTPINDLPAGSYRAVKDLYDSTANKAATRTEVVHIHAGRDTTLSRSFAAADFAACPDTVGDAKTTLKEKLEAALNSVSGTYTIVLDGEGDLGSFDPQTLSAGNKDITIILRGNGKTVSLGSVGSLFTLSADSGSKLTLELHDITLQGKDSNNNAPLVQVNSGGALVMKTGSLITGNTNSASAANGGSPGGGVSVRSGTFDMSGGAVSNNTATASSGGAVGGGVYVYIGTFTMSGGAVSNNTATATSTPASGGGVYVVSGTFDMSGGAVSGNTSSASSSSSGGGVYVTGTFNMNGGAVSGNTASGATSASGGGVYFYSGTFDMSGGAVSGNEASASAASGGGVSVAGGTFTMSEGVVSGNTASGTSSTAYGGGVYVIGGGSFEMSGGAVSGNKADTSSANTASGGGVYVTGSNSKFEMSGGAVSGNTASSSGGGVYVGSNGTFTKSGGGAIYGDTDNITSNNGLNENTATGSPGSGNAAYVYTGARKRDSTAGESDNLDSTKSGAQGGWE
jgi:hypothetical protein